MAILKDKKVVIIADRDGVPGPAIAATQAEKYINELK